jgi:hypothetical protein
MEGDGMYKFLGRKDLQLETKGSSVKQGSSKK